MKIKRYTAASMRAALAQVRAEQGPDAVILSSRRGEEGIEVIAAVDYDEALIVEATSAASRSRSPAPPQRPTPPPPAPHAGARRASSAPPLRTAAPATPAAPPARTRSDAAPRPRRPLRPSRRSWPRRRRLSAPCSVSCRICAGCSRAAWPA